MELKEYAQIDVGETPVVVLTCGHFFTSESLDLLVGMGDVYRMSSKGGYDGLKDTSAALAKTVPVCPDCRRPIRQFSTKRYNRVINKAVMDEMTRRFLSSGNQSLGELEERLKELKELPCLDFTPSDRHKAARKLARDADDLCRKMDTEHQPAKKLHDAIITRQGTNGPLSLEDGMQELAIESPSDRRGIFLALDKQVTLKARLLCIKTLETILCDKFFGKGKNMPQPTRMATTRLLESCTSVVADANEANLPRVSIEAILAYAGIFRLQMSRLGLEPGEKPLSPPWDHEAVREKISEAVSLCNRLPNSEGLREAVDSMAQLFKGTWYDEVTPQEIEAIKAAVLSGSGGIATHSGHWYNCANGHPVSGQQLILPENPVADSWQFLIGECGMPMELARCPECGAAIGGQHHQLVEGATRATAME